MAVLVDTASFGLKKNHSFKLVKTNLMVLEDSFISVSQVSIKAITLELSG